MKVILLADVPNVGKKYDIAEVKPGFARNYLFARGLGEAVTKASAKRVAELTKKREAEKARQSELLEKAFAGVSGAQIVLKRNATEEGSLYAGVTREELADELSKILGAAIEADHIDLSKPIKTLGEHSVHAALGDKKAVFKVTVEAE